MSKGKLQSNQLDVGVKNRVVDSTRKVVVGPVAHRLATRSSNRDSALKRLCVTALLVGFATCAFIVHAVLQGEDANKIWHGLALQADSDTHRRVDNTPMATVSPVVGSVMELGEAFDSLASQDDVPTKGPLRIADAPTAPIAVYSTAEDDPTDTASFIEQLGFMDDGEATYTLDTAEQPSEEEHPKPEEPVGQHISGVTAVVPGTVEERRNDSGGHVALATLVTSDGHDEAAQEPVRLTQVIAEPVGKPQYGSDELLSHAISNYRESLHAIQTTKSVQRNSAREFFAAASELCQFAHDQADVVDAIRESMVDVETDNDIFKLVSSASSSWIKWSKRSSNGVLVAGLVVGTELVADELVVSVKTLDKKRSVIRISAPRETEVAAGERAIFLGLIDDQDLSQIRAVLR